jgi:hypothetical protein
VFVPESWLSHTPSGWATLPHTLPVKSRGVSGGTMPGTSSKGLAGNRTTLTGGTLGLLLGSVFLASCGGAVDEPADGTALGPAGGASALRSSASKSGRPVEVPADFVATPHGYFHPSCVVELGDDERVADDGAIVRSGGEQRALARCQHPRYDRHGRISRQAGSATAPPPTVNGWLASFTSTSAGPVRSISASWRVPRTPTLAGAQTLYFFPGLEPAATGDTILQPVLAWNGFYDRRWTIASWNCCKDGNVLYSTPRNVSAGDTITGTVTGSKCNAAGVCSSWTVRTASSHGASTTLNTTAYGEVLDWEFAGAFEAYGVDTCNQYPPDGQLSFTSISVQKANGTLTTPAWYPASYGVSPDCMTSATADPGGKKVALTWRTQ